MRIREWFTVPEGKRITEKMMTRVLVSSICGILLCMACLAGTTWAWFTVSIENPGNVIQIGQPEVVVTVNGSLISSGETLEEGTYSVNIQRANTETDVFSHNSALYVTLSVGGNACGYTIASQQDAYGDEITIVAKKECALSWEVSWFPPADGQMISEAVIVVEDDSAETTGAESADASKEPTGDSTEVTEPTETETGTTDSTTEPTVGESEPGQESEDSAEDGAVENEL